MVTELLANRYRLLRKLGQGGMADVYLALDTVLDREVAIKVLRGELSSDPVALLRFKREAEAVSELSHPNIVEIYDVGEESGRQYIVMEYVNGQTLKQLIGMRGALYQEEAVSIMRQLVSAIVTAHHKGIIHRDIKPQNVLVKPDGTVKITDFGIALAQDAMQLTQQDSVMGSVHYLAPELARGDTATPQSDIYALGIVFYELLTGEVPFRGDAAVQIAMMHIRDSIPSCKEFNPSLPNSVDNVIKKATVKNLRFRYKNAQDMLNDLATVLEPSRYNEPPLVFKEDNEFDTSSLIVDKVKRRNRIIAGISVGVVALIGIIALVILWGGGNSKTVIIPNIVNMTKEEAEIELHNLDLNISYQYRATDATEINRVELTLPEAETEVEKGSTLTVYISTGINVVIEDYTGRNIDDVKQLLSDTKIVIRVEEKPSDSPIGTILGQEGLLPGDKVAPNIKKEIKLIVATQPKVTIPLTLLGQSVEYVEAELTNMGLTPVLFPMSIDELSEEEQAQVELGVVVKMDPEAGTTVNKSTDTKVTIYYYQ